MAPNWKISETVPGFVVGSTN